MKLIRYASALLLLISMPLTALSAGQISAVYDSEKKEVFVSGSAECIMGEVCITVLPQDVDKNTLTESTVNKNGYILRQVQSDENGAFSLNIKLPQSAGSSIYNIYAVCGEGELTASFSHVSDKEVSEVVASINAAASETVEEVFTSSQKKLGLSDDIMAKSGKIAPLLYKMKPEKGYTSNGFMDELNRIISIVRISDGEDVKNVLMKYGKSFDFSLDVNELSEKVCAGVKDYFTKQPDFTDSKKYLYQAITYAGFCSAASYVEVEKILRTFGKNGGIDFNKYDALSASKKTSVMQQLFNTSPTDFSALYASFESFTAKAAAEKNPSGDSGGSGGGGGKGMSSVGAAPKEPEYDGFCDIEHHWSRSYVEALAAKGIVSGFEDNSFRPENYVTRAEFIKLVLVASGGKLSQVNHFEDVKPGDWYLPYVNGAMESGLCKGFGGKINPNDVITREDAAVIICRALNTSYDTAGTLDYADSADISDYARDAVAALTEKGIVTGSDSGFNPKSPTKRGEAAALILRLVEFNGGR